MFQLDILYQWSSADNLWPLEPSSSNGKTLLMKTHLCHQAWRDCVGAQLEPSPILTSICGVKS